MREILASVSRLDAAQAYYNSYKKMYYSRVDSLSSNSGTSKKKSSNSSSEQLFDSNNNQALSH